MKQLFQEKNTNFFFAKAILGPLHIQAKGHHGHVIMRALDSHDPKAVQLT